MSTSYAFGLNLSFRRGLVAAVLFLASLPAFAQNVMTLTGSVSPRQASYIGTFTYSASSSGGDPATTRYAFFRRRPGGIWIPSVDSPNWQASSTYNWNPTSSDVGTWETFIWVKDGTTLSTQGNNYGYAAAHNSQPVEVFGPPTAPGPTTVSCDYTGGGECWVTGDFVASVSASTGGLGSLNYQICRSNDTTGWGGCDVNLTLTGGTSITVSGSHLPSDGYQRAYYFQSRDSAGAYSGWNSPKFVRVDRHAPSVGASNASDVTWYSNRTATVSASDSGSGLQSVRYSWGSAHNSSCTTGTSTSSGATLTAPAGDNLLYLCAKDNTGRVAQWSGRYRVSPLGLSGSVSPSQGSYLSSFTYTASASGGTPSTTRFAFFRRRPGGTWIPDVNAPVWQSGNVYSWTPASSDTGAWDTYIWVKDGDTPAGMSGHGYAAGLNTGQITVLGPPTVPGPTTAACAYTAAGECWVQGDFTASAAASTGGSGSLVYQFCRSNDTTGFGGCDVNLTFSGGTSILISGTHLPSDGYRRVYYFKARDSADAFSGWNTPLHVRVDRHAPAVSATNASDTEWFYSRTATVAASDAHSGVHSVRYSWSSALDAACTAGTATSSGASLNAPVGDNTLYLCAKDNTGRVGQWSGRYRVANGLSLTSCSVSPAQGSYAGTFTYSATASGGIPSTTRYAFFRRRPGGIWIPDVNAPTWLASNVYPWNPSQADAGTWDTFIWVKDGNTPPTQNGHGYAASCNPGQITVVGPPTVPGPTTVSCAYTTAEDCWVQGDFTASVTASTGGSGSLVYQICRSNDTAGSGGCDVNLTLTGGTSILASGTHLPADGYRRSYWFQAKDSSGALSGWNVPRYVRVDRYAPTVSASNASDTVSFSHRTATVTASDTGGSGLQGVRYNWSTALDAACTTGTATSSGSVLTAPPGDNLLYVCAKDNTGRVTQWNGRYRVSPLDLTGTVAPKPASYQEAVTYTATATGGTPATIRYAFFRRRPGSPTWIPDAAAANWQAGNTFTWQPAQADLGTWETYIWVKDGDTPATMNAYGFAAGSNTGPIDIVGAPTVPGATTVSCAYTAAGDCWVQGDFTASVTASTGGKGSLVYQICRSNDTTGFGGCDVNLTLTGGTSILVSGTHLPSDGFRRAYYFQAKDTSGALSGWNTPRYVWVDRTAPAVSATNASDSWFRSRTATISASDAGSGLQGVRYNWNTALDANCTTGTVTASGAALTAPNGDNVLYLCAKDNTARVTQWNGRYKVAASPTITVTQPPASSSYLNAVTWTVTPTGGVTGTLEYLIARHRTGSSDPWISSAWQSSNVFTWQPSLADVGNWENWVLVRDSLTAPDENGTGFSATANAGKVDIVGKPTVPGPTTVSCPYSTAANGEDNCWVAGDFTATVTPSTGGMGSLVYQICRSNDSASGFAGCDVNLTLTGGTSTAVSGSHLAADGFRRSYWFQAKDSAGALSGWNTQRYVRVDRNPPTVGADNASDVWFNSRTATVSAADVTGGAGSNSGLVAVRYNWNAALDSACTNGTVTTAGATLTVPDGDNLLYLCAKDNTGRVAQWNGRYRVTPGLLVTGAVSPRKTSHGNVFTFTATASGGAPGTYQYAFFRRRPNGAWIPAVTAPVWQTVNSFTWTPTQDDTGIWETYVWAKDANTTPTQNGHGYGAGQNTQPIEVLPALTLTSTRSPAQSKAGETLTWTATATGGDPATRQFALFRRRPGGTWMPSVNAPDWQTSNVLSWTPAAEDVGVWEIYIWVKDATTPASQNTHGYGAGYDAGPVEVVPAEEPDFALDLTPAAITIVRGGTAQYTLSITANSTFVGPAALAVSGLPPGVTHTLQPAAVEAGDTATLTVATGAGTLPATYNMIVTATAHGLTRTAVPGLTVRPPSAPGEPVIDSISPDLFDGGVVKTITIIGKNFQGAIVTVAEEEPDPDNPTIRVFPSVVQATVSSDGKRIDVQVDCTEPGIMDFYALVVDNGVGDAAASKPFRVIPAGPVVDLVTPNRPERGGGGVYVLALAGYNLRDATVYSEPAGAVDVFGVDATDDTHINGLLRIPEDAEPGPVDLVVRDPQGREARITIMVVGSGEAMVATQRLRTQRVDPSTLQAIGGPSPTVLFQRFAVRQSTEATSNGVRVLATNSLENLSAGSFSFTLYYRYTMNLFNFTWSRAFTFDPVTGEVGDAILKGLGFGDRVRFGAFVLAFHLRVDLTVEVMLTNQGFTWPRFCIGITVALQIPGLEGFYEHWDFCRGGYYTPFNSGSTSSLNATGGNCAAVTQEGPPQNGLIFAEVEQRGCCSQPIEVTGQGVAFSGSRFATSFQINTPSAGATTPGQQCTCSVTAAPACVVKDKHHSFTASGQPAGGSYQWQVVNGGPRVDITSGETSDTVTVRGEETSQAADDVELEVTYTQGSSVCSQRVKLSVIEIEPVLIEPLSFSDNGTASSSNFPANHPGYAPYGMPTLGLRSPNNPAQTTGFYNNMELSAKIKPCDSNLRCRFDFKRTRQGTVADLLPNGQNNHFAEDCPQGGCNDDPHDTDEDLAVDSSCTIFSLDVPGVGVASTTGACSAGTTDVVNCLNFNEWLLVDGVRATQDFEWHASTRIQCNTATNAYRRVAIGPGNRMGTGHIDCSFQTATTRMTAQPGAGSGIVAAPSGPTSSETAPLQSVAYLDDADRTVRANAYKALSDKVKRGVLQGRERAEVVNGLVERAQDAARDGEFWSTPLLAIELLGELRAPEAVPVLLERLLDDFARPIVGSADHATPAAQSLAKIGAPAVEPLLELATNGSDEEWSAAKQSLDLMPTTPQLREAVRSRLAGSADEREQERLRALLDLVE